MDPKSSGDTVLYYTKPLLYKGEVQRYGAATAPLRRRYGAGLPVGGGIRDMGCIWVYIGIYSKYVAHIACKPIADITRVYMAYKPMACSL